jgi:hypothetical protein
MLSDIRQLIRAHWRLGTAAAVVVLAVVAGIFTLTAWNSSSEPVAESQATTSTTDDKAEASSDPEQAMLEFAQCMRDNGVPSFPDPVAQPDGSFGFPRPQGASSSALEAAVESCQSELEAAGLRLPGSDAQDPEVEDAILDFSRCMRENGVPEFPDPQPGAGFHGLFDGIDQQSPRVQRAIQSCESILSRIFGPSHG